MTIEQINAELTQIQMQQDVLKQRQEWLLNFAREAHSPLHVGDRLRRKYDGAVYVIVKVEAGFSRGSHREMGAVTFTFEIAAVTKNGTASRIGHDYLHSNSVQLESWERVS